MRKIIVTKSSEGSVGVVFAIRGGSVYENKDNNGLFHLCEHLITGRRWEPGNMPLVAEIEDVGGVGGGFTTKDCVVLYAKAPQPGLHQVLSAFANRLVERRLESSVSETVSAEKKVIENEILEEDLNPVRQLAKTWWASAYRGNPLSFSPVGYRETLRSISVLNVIEAFKSSFNTVNTAVAIAGNVDSKKVIDQISHSLEHYPEGSVVSPPTVENIEHSRLEVVVASTKRVHIGLGFMGLQLDDPDVNVLELIGALLGGGVRSRLFQALRYRNSLVYNVGVLREYYCCGGNFLVYAVCTPENTENVANLTIKEIKKVKKGFITEEELARAQCYLAGKLALQRSDVLTYATTIARRALYGDGLEVIDEDGYTSITLEDIVRVARRVLKPTRLTAVFVGQISQKRAEKAFQWVKEMLAGE